MDQKMSKQMSMSHVVDPLSETQIEVLDMVRQQCNHEQIREELDVTSKQVYRVLKGLYGNKQYGNKQKVPQKWRVPNPYLKLRDEPEKASLKYELNSRGWKALFVAGRITENVNQGSSEEEESLPGECLVRPHYLRSKHFIRRSGSDDDSWFVELRKYFDGTEDGTGFNVYWREFRAEVYRDSIQLRIDMPMEEKPVEEMFGDYLELKDRFISHVVDRINSIKEDISIQVKSNPEMVESSIVTEEWAEFNSAFANWYYANREELRDDDSVWGGMFVVRNERDEKIAHIDCSEGEPEFEWVHSQEAKQHLQNMKDLIQWGASMEITPQDFSNLKWLRENFQFFDSFYDRMIEYDDLGERLSELEQKVSVHDVQIEAHAEQMQKNREMIAEQDEKVEDAVERVQAVQVEQDRIEGNQKDLVDRLEEMQSSHENIQETQKQLQNNDDVLLQGIESNSKVNRRMAETIQKVGGDQTELRKMSQSNYALIREMRKSRLSYRIKKALKTTVSATLGMIF